FPDAGSPNASGDDAAVDDASAPDDAADAGAADDGGQTDAMPVDADDGGAGAHALLIVGAIPVAGNDVAIRDRLVTHLPVDIVLESDADATMASGKALVVISATASLAGTNTKFRDVAVPVL